MAITNNLTNIFGIAGTALNAQTVRMNLTASNMANANVVTGTEKDAFRAKRPVFQSLLEKEKTDLGSPYLGGVKVDRVWMTNRSSRACTNRITRKQTRTATSIAPTSTRLARWWK